MEGPVTLRPLSVGEVLDVAIKIYRTYAGTLIRAVLIVVTPVQVLAAIVQVSGGEADSFTTGPEDVFDTTAFIGFLAAAVGVAILGFLATQLAQATCLKAIADAYLGRQPDWRESLGFVRDRLGSVVWLAIIYPVLLTLAFLACVVPAIYFGIAWTVATPVLLLENIRGRKALKRSRELVKGRWGPTALAVIVSSILAGIVTLVLQGVLTALFLSSDNYFAQVISGSIAQVVSSALVTPFSAAVAVVIYFDLRVRKEGFDLELLAQRIGVDAFGAGTAEPLAPIQASGAGGGPGGGGPGGPDDDDDQPPFWPPPPGWRPRRG